MIDAQTEKSLVSEVWTSLERYQKVRNQTESLCLPLLPEDYVVQPIIDVSPPKWHLGHTTWFFEQFVLTRFKSDYKIFNEDFKFLFNSYYETVGERIQRNSRGNLSRPPVADIYAYRAYVDEQMSAMLSSGSFPVEGYQLVELGLQHEQQHQELLITDIKYILFCNPLLPKYFDGDHLFITAQKEKALKYLEVEEGVYSIGYKGDKFCYDNEKGEHKVFIHSFKAANRLISNKEYLQFIEEGGYQRHEFWLSEGWDWVKQNKVQAPLYWIKKDNCWFEFSLYGLKRLDEQMPVTHISYFEANAYAAWCKKRLLTEFEWEVIANHYSKEIPVSANFQERGIFHPMPGLPQNFQFLGDAWEWTQSAYLPYPYFKKEEGAIGEYNGKFMVNQMVLRGGSCATPADHIRHSYRNFFHPHLRWQFTGIRLAQNL